MQFGLRSNGLARESEPGTVGASAVTKVSLGILIEHSFGESPGILC